jgi:hypothetical protein
MCILGFILFYPNAFLDKEITKIKQNAAMHTCGIKSKE